MQTSDTAQVGSRRDMCVVRPGGTGLRNVVANSPDGSNALWLPTR